MALTKFTGTSFSANALNLDFLRDEQGNPLKTPNSFLVLHNPVRQKCNEIIDNINDLLAGTVAFSTVKVGSQCIQEADIDNWNTVFGNNHNHTNKSNLDTINQNLGSSNSPNFTGLTVNSNTVWHAGNDGSESSLDADFLDGKHASEFVYKTTNTVMASSLTAGNWYRIAANGPVQPGQTGGKRATGKFIILSEASGAYHQSITFYASVEYGSNPSITLLHCSNYTINFNCTKIRLIAAGPYEGAAIEIYVSAINGGTFTSQITDNIHNQGWTPVNWEPGELPTGFTSTEIDIATNNAFMSLSSANKNIFELTKSGVLSIGNTLDGILKLKGGASGVSSVYLYNGSTLSGFLRHTPSAGYMEIMNYVSPNKPYVRLYDTGKIDIGSTNTNDIELTASGNVNITQNSLEINGYEVIDQNRLFTVDKLQPRAGSFILDTKTHSYGLIIKADSETTNETGTLIVNNPNISDFYGYNYSTSQFSDMRFGGTKKLYYSQSNLSFGIDTTSPQSLLDVNGYINATNGLKIGAIEVINSVRKGIFTNLDVDSININGNIYTIAASSNSSHLLTSSGYVHIFGNLAVDRKAAINIFNLSNTLACIYGTEYNNIANKVNTKFGDIVANRGIYYNWNDQKVGICNDIPTEKLDVNGFINAVSGLKIGGTSVIDSTLKGAFNGLINTGTRRSGLISNDYFFEDVAHYSSNVSSITGAFVVQTAIPFAQADMIRMKIDGYNYTDTNCIIDLLIAGYAYTSNILIKHGYINNSIKRYNIRSAKETSSGNLAIIIGEITDVFSYPKLKISSLLLGYNSVPERAEGWSISILSDLSAYDSLYSIAETSGYVLKSTNSHIIPVTNNYYDIGSSSYKFKNLYLAGDIQVNKGNFLDDITINKAAGNPSFQWQSASSSKMQMYYDVTNAQGYWQNITSGCYIAIKNDGEVLIESKSTKDIKLVSAQNVNIQTGALSMGGSIVLNSNRTYTPPSIADTSAANNTLYYSSTQSKVCYKDYGGTVHALY